MTCYFTGGNYLRVRGEYTPPWLDTTPPLELPPRARRILQNLGDFAATEGTTSACAENTTVKTTAITALGNYLRVRGEYSAKSPSFRASQELPPRARRIRAMPSTEAASVGTTSACAENTHVTTH